MIQGVHAETVVFVEFDRATDLIGVAGWPWLGGPGAMSAREVSLDGGAPRRFRVRAGQLRILKGKEVSCARTRAAIGPSREDGHACRSGAWRRETWSDRRVRP